MTRVRRYVPSKLTTLLEMTLVVGPIAVTEDDFSEAELELAWQRFGGEIMEGWEYRDGSRPWGWWTYQAGGHPPLQPGAKEIRLAELGELTDSERKEIAAKAAKAQSIIDSGKPRGYIATGGGKRLDFEAEAVELHRKVEAALREEAA